MKKVKVYKKGHFLGKNVYCCFLVISLLLSLGCAHKTIYEKCTSDDEWRRYGSVESCISEKPKEKSVGSAFFDGFSRGYNDTMRSQSNQNTQTNCTSQVLGNNVITNCN